MSGNRDLHLYTNTAILGKGNKGKRKHYLTSPASLTSNACSIA